MTRDDPPSSAPPAAEHPDGESGLANAPERRTAFDFVGELGGRRIDRRHLLISGSATGIAATAAGLGVVFTRAQDATPVGDTTGHDMAEMAPGPPTNQGFTVFVPAHAAIVQAAAARLIPTDEHGPGATEAGVVYFIDHQLARGNISFRGKVYQLGPFLPGAPTQGNQSALPLRDRFRLGILALDAYAQETYGRGFVACSPQEQDRLLSDLEQGIPESFGETAIQAEPLVEAPTEVPIGLDTSAGVSVGARAFFTLLLSWTRAGFFSDPVHGGNRDMVGWKLIGFPGAHISYVDEIEHYNQPFQGEYISLGQYQEQVGGGG
jgi:gluconate 2-dehydrogenase gamma chain